MAGRRNEASAVADRIERLLNDIEGLGDARAARTAEEMVRTLMRFYGAGLERITEICADAGLVDRLAEDDLVGGLLILHDLHPLGTEDRVAAALESVRPYLGSHAGDVEFTGIDDAGVLHLALKGSCDGCPSSLVTVKLAIENAVSAAAPEITGVEVAGVVAEPTGPGGRPLLPVVSAERTSPAPEWVDVADVGELRPGQVLEKVVSGIAVVVCAARQGLYAFTDRCPVCSATLGAAVISASTLSCPGCGSAFEMTAAGRAVDGSAHLDPLPLLKEDGAVRVAVPMTAVL